MTTDTVSVDKGLGLKVYCLLIQARRSLDRSKLGWDPDDGFLALQDFYEGSKKQLVLDTLIQLSSLTDNNALVDADAIRNRLDSCLSERFNILTGVTALLSRCKRHFAIRDDETAYLASCLKGFLDIIEQAEPPSVERAERYVDELSLAWKILHVRFCHMPQFRLATAVEVVSPPPIGKEYPVEEIVSQV